MRLSPLPSPELLAGLAVAGLVALWLFTRKGAAEATGAAVGAAVVEAGAGLVLGAGDAIGLPRTDAELCRRALAEGRTWDASFVCSAGDWLGSLMRDPPGPNSTGGASGSW